MVDNKAEVIDEKLSRDGGTGGSSEEKKDGNSNGAIGSMMEKGTVDLMSVEKSDILNDVNRQQSFEDGSKGEGSYYGNNFNPIAHSQKVSMSKMKFVSAGVPHENQRSANKIDARISQSLEQIDITAIKKYEIKKIKDSDISAKNTLKKSNRQSQNFRTQSNRLFKSSIEKDER